MQDILELGPKFNIFNSNEKIPNEKITTNIDNGTSLNQNDQNKIRASVCNTLTSYNNKNNRGGSFWSEVQVFSNRIRRSQ